MAWAKTPRFERNLHCFQANENILGLCSLNYYSKEKQSKGVIGYFCQVFFISFMRLLALRPLLTYCASLGRWWEWLWRSRWNVDWQGKPKFSSEKTCPSATFVHHKIPHDQNRVWTRAAAVGCRRLTAWAMARLFAKYAKHVTWYLFSSFKENGSFTETTCKLCLNKIVPHCNRYCIKCKFDQYSTDLNIFLN
jgi:hypothetical protein